MLTAVQALHKTVPSKYVAALKTQFKELGWKGYQFKELNPNRRRRAMVTQWLLYYRGDLFGVPLGELLARKEREGAARAPAAASPERAASAAPASPASPAPATPPSPAPATPPSPAPAASPASPASPAAPAYVFDAVAVLTDRVKAAAPVTDEELADKQLLRNVLLETSDEEVNVLAWKCLGYSFVDGAWDSGAVFPKWRERYPTPPDLLGMTRQYSKAYDEPTLRAVQALQRSTATEYKTALKDNLRPLGWTGYKMEGLTPNMTRRAQVTQWLMYYRDELHNVSLEELQRRKEERRRKEEQEGNELPTGTSKTGVL